MKGSEASHPHIGVVRSHIHALDHMRLISRRTMRAAVRSLGRFIHRASAAQSQGATAARSALLLDFLGRFHRSPAVSSPVARGVELDEQVFQKRQRSNAAEGYDKDW